MKRIKSKDTTPEKLVRRYLFKHGFRFRVCQKNLAGSPDVVIQKIKTIIFVHGCFWHMHEGCFHLPKSNTEYWLPKLTNNVLRDKNAEEILIEQGWRVLTVFECELKKTTADLTLKNLICELRREFK